MKQSPWRVPLFWLVIGLPLGCVVALALLIVQASRSPPEPTPAGAQHVGLFTLGSP